MAAAIERARAAGVRLEVRPGGRLRMEADREPSADLLAELRGLKADIIANACTALNAGCFGAGTKLWTPLGFVAIEAARTGRPGYAAEDPLKLYL